ncbi:MAG TPA: exodeoxyribonuclease VII large subunit [Candidatus Saccharimonadales bacterium]|nr:exodeoxyribonuclease VII large subunit [Candidatus Saccharimonadales bacterium]
MEEFVLTPAECLALINQTLEIAYPTVTVEGEIASFKLSQGKYVFFDLKDDEVTLSCFMMAWTLRQPLEDGMRVRVLAKPRLTKWGKFSLNIDQVMPVGEGSIKKAFELLKAKLEAEGLLDESRKRQLPHFPLRIGLIASVESAGYVDFMKILNARWRGLEIEVANVQVQGLLAIDQNIAAVKYFNEQAHPVEVLVMVRGGGSADDLAVYNDELLARAIAASRIPTLVGVGHEVDTSLADLVCDLRAATPSNAAQLLVPDQREVSQQVKYLRDQIQRNMSLHIDTMRNQITNAQQILMRALRLDDKQLAVTVLVDRLVAAEGYKMGETRQKLRGLERVLRQVDPNVVLQRGYALVRGTGGKVISSGTHLKEGDMIQVRLRDASIESEVKGVKFG